MWFFEFMGSRAGRVTRIVAGAVVILAGLFAVGGIGGVVLALVGVAPLAAGLFDVCIFAPLFRLPFGGDALRRALEQRRPRHGPSGA